MKGKLTSSQVNYVLDHLRHHAEIEDALSGLFVFDGNHKSGDPQVLFTSSGEDFDPEKVIRIDGVPVLYPVIKERDAIYTIRNKKLVFHHDLLKSAFHLLSGYEEFKTGAMDTLGRFPYNASLQKKLDIVTRPVVNYYFEWILEGLEKFCALNRIPFSRKPVFEKPVLMLSHDIDRLDAYHFRETAFKFKQLVGLAPSPYRFGGRMREAATALYHFSNPFSRTNPFWTFDYLHRTGLERGFRSTYFFLEKEGRHQNSRYRFHEKRMRALFREISERGDEVGLHGTIRSATDRQALNDTLRNLQENCPDPVVGIRQHFLKYTPLETALLHHQAGLKYDATLGFAEHEGFRHSYCWPYRLYDHRNDNPIDLWEIPLTVMEVTFFYYRKLNMETALGSVKALSEEVKKFNGVFTLLWHNHFFDEREFPGINSLYIDILDHLRSTGMEGSTGREIMQKMADRELR